MNAPRALCAAIGLSLGATEAFADRAVPHIALEQQAADIPDEFVAHFFNVPVAVRVVAQGEYLGEAMAVLSTRDTVTLLHFTDHYDSPWPDAVRARVLEMLRHPQAMGTCVTARCATPWRRLAFDRMSSTLDIVTVTPLKDPREESKAEAPTHGSGILVNQRINIVHDGHGDVAGRYWIDTLTSRRGWTATVAAQHERATATTATPAPRRTSSTTRLRHAYAERQFKGHFVRGGAFYPDTIGLYQQPLMVGARAQNVLGVMVGSSDALDSTAHNQSAQPIYVSANRPGHVEIYRQGTLINTQQLKAGLQMLDTAMLPGGIYAVELRVVEDGTVTSTSVQWVYKPTLWTNTQRRWRYNVFAGRQMRDAPGIGGLQPGIMAYGAAANFMVHPRVVLGLSATTQRREHATTASINAQPTEWSMIYANVYRASRTGSGGNIQFNMGTPRSNVGVAYGDTWVTAPSHLRHAAVRRRTWSLTGGIRPNQRTMLNLRMTGRDNAKGLSYDVVGERMFTTRQESTTVRASLFNRPLLTDNRHKRHRGFEISATIALSPPAQAWSATAGTQRQSASPRNNYARIEYVRSAEGPVPLINADVRADNHGVGAAGGAQFQNRYLRSDVFANRSSLQGTWAGGLNLDTTLALGAGHASVDGAPALRFARSVVAVDVDGGIDAAHVRATLRDGTSVRLRQGRNLIPVHPFIANRINFDVEGANAPSAKLDRRSVDFRTNAGDVLHSRVSLTRTVPALGRLVDSTHRPIAGATLVTPVDRTVSEASGIFSLALDERNPTMAASSDERALCTLAKVPWTLSEGDHLAILGDVVCTPTSEGEAP